MLPSNTCINYHKHHLLDQSTTIFKFNYFRLYLSLLEEHLLMQQYNEFPEILKITQLIVNTRGAVFGVNSVIGLKWLVLSLVSRTGQTKVFKCIPVIWTVLGPAQALPLMIQALAGWQMVTQCRGRLVTQLLQNSTAPGGPVCCSSPAPASRWQKTWALSAVSVLFGELQLR